MRITRTEAEAIAPRSCIETGTEDCHASQKTEEKLRLNAVKDGGQMRITLTEPEAASLANLEALGFPRQVRPPPPSFPSLPLSLSRSLRTPSTPSLPHSLTPSPSLLTPSLLTPSLPHSLTPCFPAAAVVRRAPVRASWRARVRAVFCPHVRAHVASCAKSAVLPLSPSPPPFISLLSLSLPLPPVIRLPLSL